MNEMNPEIEKLLKKILDSRLAWDVFQGPVYNRVIWDASGEIVREMIDDYPPPVKAARVLDVGAGPGWATMYAAEKYPGCRFTGIDNSAEQVKYARRNLRKRNLKNCKFVKADAMDLPYGDRSFDMVMSIASIKHWPDATQGLREIHRVLKPGGTAHIGEADRDCDSDELKAFIEKFAAPWWANKKLIGWYLRTTVFGASMTMREAEKMAKEAGFKEIKIERVHGMPVFRMMMEKK